jgi:hypothetical protein
VPKFPKFYAFLLRNEQKNDNFATWLPQNWLERRCIIWRWIRWSAWLLFVIVKRWEVWGQQSVTRRRSEQGNRRCLNSEDRETFSGSRQINKGRRAYPSLKPRISVNPPLDFDGKRDPPERVRTRGWFTEMWGSD